MRVVLGSELPETAELSLEEEDLELLDFASREESRFLRSSGERSSLIKSLSQQLSSLTDYKPNTYDVIIN